jgi:hypothetical protein
MKKRRLVRGMEPSLTRAAVIFTVLLLSSFAFGSTPQGQFEKTYQVAGPVDLEVQTHSGDITVRSGPAGSVTVRGKIYVGDHWLFGNHHTDVSDIEQNPPIRREGNSIRVDYVNARDISIDYEITVPANTSVRTRSGSGDQTIEGTHGNADLQSGSGEMKLSQITGDVRIQTGSGNVKAREIAGAVHGGAGSGDIELEETAAGDIDLRTGSGNVTVRGVNGALHLEAGSGDITADGKQSGSWEVRTGSGNVHVHLPADAAFDANISTSSGTLDVDAPITMTVQGRINETHHQIEGKVRGGGPLLSLRTGSGDIHID